MPEFHRIKPLLVNVSNPSGSVKVVAEERETVEVTVTPLGSSTQDQEAADATFIELANDELVVEAPTGSSYLRSSARLKVEVHTPLDSSLHIRVASASFSGKGSFESADVSSASGDIEIHNVTGDARINSASGDVRINDVGGKLRAKTASGNLTVSSVDHAATINSASGNIEIGEAHSDVRSKSASGELRIGKAHHGNISANSASGDVSVGVVPGVGVWLDLDSMSGRISNDLDTSGEQSESHDLSIQVRTKSGDIEINKARDRSTV